MFLSNYPNTLRNYIYYHSFEARTEFISRKGEIIVDPIATFYTGVLGTTLNGKSDKVNILELQAALNDLNNNLNNLSNESIFYRLVTYLGIEISASDIENPFVQEEPTTTSNPPAEDETSKKNEMVIKNASEAQEASPQQKARTWGELLRSWSQFFGFGNK